MRQLTITVKGSFPLMCDRMSDEVLDALATKKKLQSNADVDFKTRAAAKIYRLDMDKDGNPTGPIGLPTTMIFASLVEAGRMTPFQGKKMISTAKSTLLPALMQLQSEFVEFTIPDGAKETPWEVDKRRGRLKDGTAVSLIRPKFKDWGFIIVVNYDEKLVTEKTVVALFKSAGQFQGLGSFRPNCKGPFGTFSVTNVKDTTPEGMDASTSDKNSLENTDGVEIETQTDEELAATSGGNGNGHSGKKRGGRLATTGA